MSKFDDMAAEIFFTGKLDPDKYNLMYRKGKNTLDVVDAKTKALKHGRLKTETELSMLSLYLAGLFKAKK